MIHYHRFLSHAKNHEESEITDSFEEWETRIHPEDRSRVLNVRSEYLGGRLPEYEIEHRLRHKDGSYRWILSRGVSSVDRHAAAGVRQAPS